MIEQIHNINLEPLKKDDFNIALKNHCLYTIYNDEEVIATNKKYLSFALDFASKKI
jgi:hypothetical protein